MENFESAIQNYRQSRGTIAQSMLEGTVGQLEDQQQMTETKAQIISAADNTDSSNNIAVNMSNTLDKLGLDFGVKEIGAKALPWVSKKIAGKVVSMNTARAAREADRLGARPSNTRLPDANNPASGDGTTVNTGRGLGQDAGASTNPAIGPRAPPQAAGADVGGAGADVGGAGAGAAGGQDINIAGKAAADAGDAAGGGVGDVFAALRGALPGDLGNMAGGLGRIAATTSDTVGMFSAQAAKLARGRTLGAGYDPASAGRISFRRTPRRIQVVDDDAADPFQGSAGGRQISSSFTPRQDVTAPSPATAPDVSATPVRPPTTLTRDTAVDQANADAATAARRGAVVAGEEVTESTVGSDALAIAGRGIGMLADILGPAAALYGIIEAGHGLYEDAKLQSNDAFKQANTVIAQAQQQQNSLTADISADQFASKVGAARPSFGSLAAPSMDTSQMASGGGGQF